jgi:dTDP-4-dehydrorhamnose reductase
MKILISGGSGLLGTILNEILSESNDILTLYNRNKGNCSRFRSAKCELTDFNLLKEIFDNFKPDIVVHLAAITSPEISDSMPYADVRKINVGVTKFISGLCGKYNSRLIFTSTDLIYDSNGDGMLHEDAKINPLSNYALTKYEAENEIKKIFDNYTILRLSLQIGFGFPHVNCFFQNMYNKFGNHEKVNLFFDQYRTPISVIHTAEIISFFCDNEIKNLTVNCGGAERISRVGLGELLCDIAGFDKSLINPISLSDAKSVKPVKDVSLSSDLLKSFGIKIPTTEESITRILNYTIRK